ncbi:MAG TPA: hypothetical protein VEU08_00120 [Vicinamibacterales bacterium]|nr:hypothetical protein [Vicinamibacterales bacterium]
MKMRLAVCAVALSIGAACQAGTTDAARSGTGAEAFWKTKVSWCGDDHFTRIRSQIRS